MVKFGDYIKFYRLAKKRSRSHEDYIEFEKFQATLLVESLLKKGIDFNGKTILDIGSGRGGYAKTFQANGASPISLDLTKEFFLHPKGARFVLGSALSIPLKANSVDMIFCSSIIEHVKTPDIMISEIKRVLKKTGICYLSFPPFWSPVGAHQFKPFHYLGEKLAIRLSRTLYGVRSHTYDDKYGKLYIRKISEVKRLIRNNNLKIRSITTRMSPINFAVLPIVSEVLTWHVEFLIEKS